MYNSFFNSKPCLSGPKLYCNIKTFIYCLHSVYSLYFLNLVEHYVFHCISKYILVRKCNTIVQYHRGNKTEKAPENIIIFLLR